MLSQPSCIIGVDPGLHGAFACLDPVTKTVIDARIIPTTTQKRNRKMRTLLDIPSLIELTRSLRKAFPNGFAFMELVGANRMAGRAQGGSSMFSFGNVNGAIETALVAAGFPYKKVTPSQWKTALACPADKDAALSRATELMPASGAYWTPKRGTITKEDCKGVAEAAMIAFFGLTRLDGLEAATI